MFDVKTKQVEEQRFVSLSALVRIGELEQFIVSTVSKLTKSHTVTDHAFTLYHGEVNEHSDGPVEVCLPTAAGDKCLPAGEVAFTVATGSHCDFPEIIGSYDAVACWAQEHGRKLDGPPREIYRFDPAQGEEPRMEIAWSIR